MATTREGARLTEQHRAAQLAIRAGSIQSLLALWRGVDPANLRGTIDTFIEAAVLLTERGFERSSQEAIRYFESFRRQEVARGPAAAAVKAIAPDPGEVAADLRGAALAGIVGARRRGLSIGRASDVGLSRVVGTLVKRILAGGRMTLLGSVDSDPVATGWVRVTTGDPCAFCRLLASRGEAYKTEKAAEFEPHGNCACTVQPIYPGPQLPGGPLEQSATYLTEYTTAQKWAKESGTLSKDTANNSLNNYRRWLANGSPEPGQKVTGAPGE